MKNIYKISGVILSVFLIYSCKKDNHSLPSLTTSSITNITYTTAISGGIVTNEGGTTVVSRGVCWNTSADPTTSNNITIENAGLGAFVSNITNLSPNTTYHVRAYAISSFGTGYGDDLTFTTSQVALPVLTTTPITGLTQITAVSGGNITADNGGSVTARGVCWATVTNPTIADSKTTDGAGTGSFISTLTNLVPGTTYYVKSYATNTVGTSYGNELTLITNPPSLPVLTTSVVSSITLTTATSGGNVSSDGGGLITARGICWNTVTHPTISDSKTTSGTGTGAFTSSLTGLAPATVYYVRAYATNSGGTSYGNELSFTTAISTVTDIDLNVYNILTIGAQVWMTENLKTTKYRNGDPIGTTVPATKDVSGESTPKYQWAYNGDESNVASYGRLYSWYAITDSRNVCPTGWHVPTDAEWTTLTTYLGGESVAGGKMKEVELLLWQSPNTGATNESGFSGLPGGSRDIHGTFSTIGVIAGWWSSTEFDASSAWHRALASVFVIVDRGNSTKVNGVSVRCVKD